MKLTPSLRRILIALKRDGDMDAAGISAAAHVGGNTLSGGGYLTKLLTMKLIRVSKWVRAEKSGPFRPIYSVSPGESKPKPEAYTAGEKTRRWRQKARYRSAEWRVRQQTRHSLNYLLAATSGARQQERITT